MAKKRTSKSKAIEAIRDFMYLEPYKLCDYIICGSIRRSKDTVGDVDVILIGEFADGEADKYKESGGNKARTYNYKGVQINLWTCKPDQLGSFTLYATGSGEFNRALRSIAIEKGMKLSQYGLFDKKSERLIARESEKQIFNALKLNYIPPRDRNMDNFRMKTIAYRMRTSSDLSYVERYLGRVIDKSIYPVHLRSILPITIPVGMLGDFVKR